MRTADTTQHTNVAKIFASSAMNSRRHHGVFGQPAKENKSTLGGRLRFRQSDVDTWLDALYEKRQPQPIATGCPDSTPRRPGRPTKAEQVARRAGKAASNLRTLN